MLDVDVSVHAAALLMTSSWWVRCVCVCSVLSQGASRGWCWEEVSRCRQSGQEHCRPTERRIGACCYRWEWKVAWRHQKVWFVITCTHTHAQNFLTAIFC